jgi:alpha-glucosidase (family GH31 glycosyl hydrolase)
MNLLPEFCDMEDSSINHLPWRGDISDQFMLGDNLLVAPMFAGEKKRKIILPNGKWFDFYTGKYVGKHQVIEVEPGLDHIPLYVKDGGMIPMITASLHTPSHTVQVPLEIRCYGDQESQFDVYDDDGVTFNYQHGESIWYRLRTAKDKNHHWKGEVILSGQQMKTGQYSTVKWIFMTENKAAHQ